MNLVINYYWPSSSLIILSLLMVCFARLYYWLDFSPETSFQTLFILGLIPLNWIVNELGFFDHFHFVLSLYLLMFITLGSFRIYKKKFFISDSQITVQLIRSKSYLLDNSRTINFQQHSRGKLFNFGCILVPIVGVKNTKKHPLLSILFYKRHDAIFSGFYRMDGVRNPKELIQNLKNKVTDEKI
ncbi:MAG: hypothetical protein FGM14_13775 [Flavobacteriales bacterium]|nr:hypothetical protein [Flavobacteriales bacterium]